MMQDDWRPHGIYLKQLMQNKRIANSVVNLAKKARINREEDELYQPFVDQLEELKSLIEDGLADGNIKPIPKFSINIHNNTGLEPHDYIGHLFNRFVQEMWESNNNVEFTAESITKHLTTLTMLRDLNLSFDKKDY